MNTDKLAINWQNIARVQLQLKFAFIIRPYDMLLADDSLLKGIIHHLQKGQTITGSYYANL